MILVYLILLIFGETLVPVLGVTKVDPTRPHCFHFTWFGRTTPATNCSTLTTVPCIPPTVLTIDQAPPNVTYMWNNLDQSAISCPLDDGFACIKYSYTYDQAALNQSYFCGKMVEDPVTPISSGCYTQKVRGYVVEVCGCRSEAGRIPCNSSFKTRRSIKLLIILTLISMFLCNI